MTTTYDQRDDTAPWRLIDWIGGRRALDDLIMIKYNLDLVGATKFISKNSKVVEKPCLLPLTARGYLPSTLDLIDTRVAR